MKPINVIKSKIEDDILKHKSGILCKIVAAPIMFRNGVNIVTVEPLDENDAAPFNSKASEEGSLYDIEKKFPVVITNNSGIFGLSDDIMDKYYVHVVSISMDNPYASHGVLVSKTSIDHLNNVDMEAVKVDLKISDLKNEKDSSLKGLFLAKVDCIYGSKYGAK